MALPNFSSVQPLQDKATQLENTAVNTQAAGMTLGDKLREAINSRFVDNPIAKDREGALSTFLQSPDQARAAVADKVNSGTILSPTQQQSIMSGIRANAIVPLTSLNDLMKSFYGGIGDAVQAGTNAFGAQTAQAQGAAQVARNSATSALDTLYKQGQLGIQQEQLDLQRSKQGLSQNFLQSILAKLNGKGGNAGGGMPSETAPDIVPSDSLQSSAHGIHSPGGQWIFNRQMQQWQPSDIPEGKYTVGTQAVDDATGTTWQYSENGWTPAGGGAQPNQTGIGSVLTPDVLSMGLLSGALQGGDISALQNLGIVGKKATPTQKQSAVIAQEAMNQLGTLRSILGSDPNAVRVSNVPILGNMGNAGAYKNSSKMVLNALLNLYSGKAVSDKEYQRYQDLVSNPLQDPSNISTNLDSLYNTLSGIYNLGQTQ